MENDMEKAEFEIFVHAQGAKPRVATGSREETLQTFLGRLGVLDGGQGDLHVFVGENDEALNDPDDEQEDRQEPVDIGLTLEALRLHHKHHIHCHRCRRVAVEVNFGGKAKARKFSPATTVGVVAQWARRVFRLDAAAAAEYVLQLCGTTDQPRPDVHIGELVTTTKCALCFDLVKEVTPQG